MGTSTSSEEFVAKLLRTANHLNKLDRTPELLKAAQAATKVEKGFMAGAVGADLRMGKMKLGVRYDKVSNGYIVKATGPAHLIERDTSSHWIASRRKRGGRTRKGNAGFLGGMQLIAALTGGAGPIGGGLGRGRTGIKMPPSESGWSMYAKHPGTKGKHPFERGQDAAIPVAARAYTTELTRNIAAVFG